MQDQAHRGKYWGMLKKDLQRIIPGQSDDGLWYSGLEAACDKKRWGKLMTNFREGLLPDDLQNEAASEESEELTQNHL